MGIHYNYTLLRAAGTVLLGVTFLGEPVMAADKKLTLELIYGADEDERFDFTPDLPAITWLDEAAWLERRADEGGSSSPHGQADEESSESRYLKVDARTGESEPFFDHAEFEGLLEEIPGVDQATASKLAYGRLNWNEGHDAALFKSGNDLFLLELGGDDGLRVRRLTFDPAEEVGEEFSPDGRFVSFVRDSNVVLLDLQTGRERALTDGGSSELLYGRLDWVYQEEIYGRGNFKGYWWSPDSKSIALLRFDESPVREFTVVDHLDSPPTVEVTNYPKAGAPNPEVTLGVVPVLGGETRWMDTGRYGDADHLIVSVGWRPDSSEVVFQVQDREQTWLDLLTADPSNGEVTTLLEERSEAFVQMLGEPTWLADGGFLWRSERTGYQHLYRYSADGQLVGALTEGEWEVRSFLGVDEDDSEEPETATTGTAWYLSMEHDPIAPQLYKVALTPGGVRARVSPSEGSFAVRFSPEHRLFYATWSRVDQPPRAAVFDAANGERLRWVDEGQIEGLDEFEWGSVERHKVPTRDGFEMEAMLIKPPNFDPSKKYPVLQYNYGGPHAPVVRDAWAGRRWAWHQMLAQQGIVIWMCDNRSASGKGIAPVYEAYGRMGVLELQDIEDGLDWLVDKSWVDAERIAIWGWSYGGFMASYALTHSTRFAAGIAGAPVTDWRFYDSVYTERYMKRPQANPEGYAATSVVDAAADLSGDLLLIHGTIDDNVHLENSMHLAHALQKAGKQFEFMVYPKSRHGVRDSAQEEHLYTLMTDFLVRKLKPELPSN